MLENSPAAAMIPPDHLRMYLRVFEQKAVLLQARLFCHA